MALYKYFHLPNVNELSNIQEQGSLKLSLSGAQTSNYCQLPLR